MKVIRNKIKEEELTAEPLKSVLRILTNLKTEKVKNPRLEIYKIPILEKGEKHNFVIHYVVDHDYENVRGSVSVVEVDIRYYVQNKEYAYVVSDYEDDRKAESLEELSLLLKKAVTSYLNPK